MNAAELIETVEARGGRIRIDGEDLVIVPKKAVLSVLEELRRYKPEIVSLLSSRPAMPSGVKLVRWEPKAVPFNLSPCERVVDTDKFIRSTLRQLEAQLSGRDWLAGWPLSTLIERLGAAGCVVALDNPKAALQ